MSSGSWNLFKELLKNLNIVLSEYFNVMASQKRNHSVCKLFFIAVGFSRIILLIIFNFFYVAEANKYFYILLNSPLKRTAMLA